MKLAEGGIGKVVVARLAEGEDLFQSLTDLANRAAIDSGTFFVIGALSKARVMTFHKPDQAYAVNFLNGPLEILSCTGTVSMKEGKRFIHAHMLVADSEGKARGGHIEAGCRIEVTGEVVMMELKGIKLERKLDEASGFTFFLT